jgi:hypothetical protein
MNPRRLFVILLTVACFAVAGAGAGVGWYAHSALAARNAAPAAGTRPAPAVQTVNGETVVVVSPDAQRASHLAVATLAPATVTPTRTADATVVDLQPYFDLVSRLAAARADVDTATAEARNAHAQFARSQTLFDDDRNISRKSLQDAQAAMQAGDAKLSAARATLATLDATLHAQFGAALAAAAAAPPSASDLLRRLQTGRAAVLRVTLPAGGERASAPLAITVDAPDGQPVAAQRLSASPSVDPAVQGEPWLYASERALPAGLHTSAQVPAPASPSPVAAAGAASLVIPSSAVLWYGGQTWAYVKIAPDRFARRFVNAGPDSHDARRGVIVTSGFHAGDQVVTEGAQLLLAEELKPQGNATVCKDPPECDD